MRSYPHIVAVLFLTFIGCSSSPPQTAASDEPQTVAIDSPSTADDPEISEGEQNLERLHSTMGDVISRWYGAEDHSGEVRTLTVIDDRDGLAEHDMDIISLELREGRVDPSQPEDHCYEGTIYVDVQDGEVTSVGRYGHDCCPETECVMGPENWMGRLFDHSRAQDLGGIRDLIHPDHGLTAEEISIDRDEDYVNSVEFHHSADELIEENYRSEWGSWMSCGPSFFAGFDFSCGENDEKFTCSCYVSGIYTYWTWQWLGNEAYLVHIERTWSD